MAYLNSMNVYKSKIIGKVFSTKKGIDDNKTFFDVKFSNGDILFGILII